jgi:hypothetical protein
MLSLNNSGFGDYLHLIYLRELKIKDTNPTPYILDLHLEIGNGGIKRKLCDKHDDFTFPIVNFPLLNIPTAPSNGSFFLSSRF